MIASHNTIVGTTAAPACFVSSMASSRITETEVSVWLVDTQEQLGTHKARLFIYSSNAVNEPETVWVELTMHCPVQITGDVNNDGFVNQGDIIYMINHVLRAGPNPKPLREAGDVNCDAALNQSDIIYLVNNVLRAGPSPCNVCQFF